MRLGIIANTGKPRIIENVQSFLSWLQKRDISCVVADNLLRHLNLPNLTGLPVNQIGSETDVVLSFGGDGTFLQSARFVAPHETPIVGVNLGGLGYLAEVNFENLNDRILDLEEGNFFIQDRMMLELKIDENVRYAALNDVVLDKGGFARTIRIETLIDDDFLNEFKADGLIVATATGSTGYSLSSGGPILEPDVEGMIINPICPHMLANRSLVVSSGRKLTIHAFSELGRFQLAVDGQQVMDLASGSRIVIQKAPYKTRIVCFNDYSFFSALRTKLQWRRQLSGKSQ